MTNYSSEKIREKYHNDSLFHHLTDWMVEIMMNEHFTISRKDFVDAINMASCMVKAYNIDYGCLLNLLKEKEEK